MELSEIVKGFNIIFGDKKQMLKVIEESSELNKELSKWIINYEDEQYLTKVKINNIISELVDLDIVIFSLKEILNKKNLLKNYETLKKYKMDKMINTIKKYEKGEKVNG